MILTAVSLNEDISHSVCKEHGIERGGLALFYVFCSNYSNSDLEGALSPGKEPRYPLNWGM